MKGAMMLPMRPNVEADPIPTLRTSVGKISDANRQTTAQAMEMKHFPINANRVATDEQSKTGNLNMRFEYYKTLNGTVA